MKVIMKIDEYDTYVAITCIRVTNVGNVNQFITNVRMVVGDIPFQVFNADKVAGWKHLYFATINALNAFENKRNKTKTLQMEILLYASGEKQINKAIDLLGIKEKNEKIALLILFDKAEKLEEMIDALANAIGGEVNDDLLEILTEEKFQEIYSSYKVLDTELSSVKAISSDAKESLTNLIIERGALLSIED